MNSPLGKYSQIVAAIVACTLIGAYVAVIALGAVLGAETKESAAALRDLALIAVGAVFGSFAAVNGVKGPIDSAHSRIDKIEVATAIPTHGAQLPIAGNLCPVCGLPIPAGEAHAHPNT